MSNGTLTRYCDFFPTSGHPQPFHLLVSMASSLILAAAGRAVFAARIVDTYMCLFNLIFSVAGECRSDCPLYLVH